MLLLYDLQHRLPVIDTSTLVLVGSAEPAPSPLLPGGVRPGHTGSGNVVMDGGHLIYKQSVGEFKR
ncbi:MAG TPA: hypothetical protein VF148_12040 [Acidimicrobiia bacterium]